jgi:hypothetical protein
MVWGGVIGWADPEEANFSVAIEEWEELETKIAAYHGCFRTAAMRVPE